MTADQSRVRRFVSRSLFDARWLMAPFYLGLVLMLGVLLLVFLRELARGVALFPQLKPGDAILVTLSLIDLTLVPNLLLIVVLAGYENFVGRIESGDEPRPAWIGIIDFSAMKVKVMGSIIAISSIALLRVFMVLEAGGTLDDGAFRWMAVIHSLLILTILALALAERIFSPVRHRGGTLPG